MKLSDTTATSKCSDFSRFVVRKQKAKEIISHGAHTNLALD